MAYDAGVDISAKTRLNELFPAVGPWTSAALWHGRTDPAPIPTKSIRDELQTICDQRLSALTLRYLRDVKAVIEPECQQILRQTSFAWMSMAIAAADAAQTATLLLESHGIDALVSKGPGIARFYPGIDCRPYADVDLLVRPADFPVGVALFEKLGWTEEVRNQQPWSYFRARCREGLNLRTTDGGGIDLHHRIPPWIWSSRLRFRDMSTRAEAVGTGSGTLTCLSAVDNLMVASLHLVSDRNDPGHTLMIWRDVLELARAVPSEEAARVATECGLAGWLRAVLLAMPHQVRNDELIAVLPDDSIPHPHRLAYLLSRRASDLGVIASQFLRLPVGNGVQFVAGMTVPSRQFLHGKYPGSAHPYWTWWSNGRDRWH